MEADTYQAEVEKREKASLVEDILGYPTCEYDREELEQSSLKVLYHVERIEATSVNDD